MQDNTIITKRLDAILSDMGFCARRKVEDFLFNNNVTINGKKITEPGIRVALESDDLKVDGKKVELKQNTKDFVYYVINKPKGIMTTASETAKRRTVTSFVPNKARIYPVGRLDEQSTGLVLLTNDGELTHKLTNPEVIVPKTYFVWVVGTPAEKRLDKVRQGLLMKEGKIKPVSVTVLKSSAKRTLLEVVLNDWKNHQLRTMFARVGINVVELKSLAIGSLQLAHLGIGKFRELSSIELAALKKDVEAKAEPTLKNP